MAPEDFSMPSLPSVAERIRQLLAKHNLDVKDLAKSIRVAPRTVSSWKAGDTEPGATHVALLCGAFKVSADYMLGRVESESGLTPGSVVLDLDAIDAIKRGDAADREVPIGFPVPDRPHVVPAKEAARIASDLQEQHGKRRWW